MSAWIFQGKPSRYDLEKQLKAGKVEEWTAYQNNTAMEPGDIVFFWRAAEGERQKRGMYGWGRIIRKPALDEDSGYWVPVRYEQRFPKFIPSEVLRANKKFASHQLFTFAVGTNFRVSDEEFEGICEVIRATVGEDFVPSERGA